MLFSSCQTQVGCDSLTGECIYGYNTGDKCDGLDLCLGRCGPSGSCIVTPIDCASPLTLASSPHVPQVLLSWSPQLASTTLLAMSRAVMLVLVNTPLWMAHLVETACRQMFACNICVMRSKEDASPRPF